MLTAALGIAAPAGMKSCTSYSSRLGLPGCSIYGEKAQILPLMEANGPLTGNTE